MTCPYLEYRASDGERSFDAERAYCTAADRFVQPMRADVCNDRYDLRHDEHCEIYLSTADGAAAGGSAGDDGPAADSGGAAAGGPAAGDGGTDGDGAADDDGTAEGNGPNAGGGD